MLKNYGLSIALITLFLLSWIGQLIFQWIEFESTQRAHGQIAFIEEFVPEFWARTFENWQSEFLQLFTFVILSTYLIHKSSPQSRDGSDQMQAQLDRIEKKLKSKN
jgi:hypothetical protein